jgi:mycothiol synthase
MKRWDGPLVVDRGRRRGLFRRGGKVSQSDLVVRVARSEDRPALRSLASDAFDLEPMQRAELADLLYTRPPEEPRLRLVIEVDGAIVGFAFGSVHDAVGYVDAIAVAPAVRRRSVGSTLLAVLESELRHGGATTLQMGGNTCFYAWPGVDLRYTAALRLAARAGYTERDVAQNMDVSLAAWVPGTAERVLRWHGNTAELRRANAADWPDLEAFVRDRFGEVWRHEADLVLHHDRPTVFVARRRGRIVGFACHGVYRVEWFGPIGTDPDVRGSGTGEALLRLCLDDLAAAGIATAQIGWVGPVDFYSRTVGATVGRRFAILAKDATD